jgi:hypothetical protein
MGYLFGPESRFVDAIVGGAKELFHTWSGIGIRSGIADDPSWTPTFLADVLEAAFWASLSVEEGRAIRGELYLVPPGDNENALTLVDPRDVTTRNLVYMLTSAHDCGVGIGVGPSGDPQIWGLLEPQPSDSLRVQIMGPGVLVASIGSHPIALFRDGKASRFPQVFTQPLVNYLAGVLWKDQPPVRDKLLRAQRLLLVVEAMHRHGHGATLVVLPSDRDIDTRGISFRYRFDERGANALKAELREIERIGGVGLGGAEEQEVIDAAARTAARIWGARVQGQVQHEVLQRIGGLSAIDGALVVLDDLTLLGFGAKLSAASSEPAEHTLTRVDSIDGNTVGPTSIAELGGTRHQSAAQFVASRSESNIFVCSQDGGITWLRWGEGSVLAIANLQYWISND